MRTRSFDAKGKWKLVNEYPITDYKCGVRAWEKVRLRKELVVRDHQGKPTRVHPSGEVWTVLSGAAEPPLDVWLRQPDGKRHTWSDDDYFWEWFERVSEDAEGNRKRVGEPRNRRNTRKGNQKPKRIR